MQNKPALTLVKIGGKVLDNPVASAQILEDFSSINGPKILVHGGGNEASRLAESMGIQPLMVEGRRVTDAAMLDIVVMTYAGLLNKKMVAQMQSLGQNALGLTGADGNSILSVKRPFKNIDFGFVGDVVAVNATFIHNILTQNIVPIFCAITHDGQGQLLNTNADTIASQLAIALSELYNVKLYYCFEKSGVLEDVDNEDSLIKNINEKIYKNLREKNAIHSGMIPKLDNCFEALNKGVKSIIIGHHTAIASKDHFTTISL